MSDARKLAAIVAADVAGYSRLAGADEERTLARLRALRSDLIDPTIAVYSGRVVKRVGDGILVEFRSVVDAVRCAIDVQNNMVERNAGLPQDQCIEFRIGIHLGDVVEESDGDLMGEGVNIAARLQGIASPGAICLSEDAYRLVRTRLDLVVNDLGITRLKNIASCIRVFSLQVRSSSHTIRRNKSSVRRRRTALVFATAGLLGSFILALNPESYFVVTGRVADIAAKLRPGTAHLSIVVLPFTNLSNDTGQDYFADGITENLTTDLSRIRNSFVIARNTAFSFKGKNSNVAEISNELGVRYVLEGSVQCDQSRVRINAQLIDGKTGAQIWAERFEEDIADVLRMQDQVVARLANTLGHELIKAEARQSLRSSNPDVIDLDMRGWSLVSQRATRASNITARSWFEQALKIDPNDPDALAGTARTYLDDYSFGWTDPSIDYDKMILGASDRSIALAPDNARAYHAKSVYLFLSRRAKEAIGAADAGLAVDRNFAALYGARGGAETSLGRFEQAISDVQQAIRLSPRDPIVGIWHVMWADAELGLAHFDAAIDQYRTAIEVGFRTYVPYANMAAAYALAGKIDEARSALTEARRLNPDLNVKWLLAHGPNVPRLSDGLRKAGLPEGEAEAERGLAARTPASIFLGPTMDQAHRRSRTGSGDPVSAKIVTRAIIPANDVVKQ